MKPRLSVGPLALGTGEVTGEQETFLSSEDKYIYRYVQTTKKDSKL